jgi:phosphatidylserine synthase
LIIFEPPLGFNLILCLFLSAMIFAPILIVHPLRVIAMRPYTIIFSVLWLSFALGYLMIPSLVENLMVNIGFTLVSLYFVMLCLWRSVRLPTGKA